MKPSEQDVVTDAHPSGDISYIDIQFQRAKREQDGRIVVNSFGINPHSKDQLILALEDVIASIKADSLPA